MKRAVVGEPVHEPIDDPAFPGLTAHTGVPYVVEGPTVGRVEIREGHRLVVADGVEGQLRPPRGVGRRSADDVSVAIDGRTIELHHRRLKAAVIRVDGEPVATMTAPKLQRRRRPNDRATYTTSWRPGVDPRVVGVAHALASRYGVGAPGAGRRFLGTLADLFAGGF